MHLVYTALVILPFAVFLVLLVFKKTPLLQLSLYASLLTSLVALFAWQTGPIVIAGSILKGFLVALDIFFIIFGAILFLEIISKHKIIKNISYYLETVSRDLRIQVILLGWFFVNFIEGTAGFGTASAVVVPLLMTLGITPLNAVVIGLLGNSASGLFGAAGTPIKIGFGSLAGTNVPLYAALINFAGMIVPVFILWFLIKSRKSPIAEFFEALPFAIWSGFAFSFMSLVGLVFGQEFPTILGSLFGLVLVLLTTSLGLFVPKKKKDMIDGSRTPDLKFWQVAFPYFLFIGLLVVGKITIGTTGVVLNLPITHKFAFYNPGFAFVLTSLVTIFVFRDNLKSFLSAAGTAFKKSYEPFFVIMLMSAFAQIMLNSGNNGTGLPSMVNFVANDFKNVLLPVWAPILGAFGSFLTGSLTVSNIMFGNFLAQAAMELGLNTEKILALAAVGGAAGNMIALGDIITAESVVGLVNSERKVLKNVMIPCLIYVAIVCVVGILIS